MSTLKLTVCGLLAAASLSTAALAEGLPDFTVLVAQNAAAVVNISTTQTIDEDSLPQEFDLHGLPEDSPFRDFFKRFFDELPERHYDTQSLGSGFVISEDGYVLTAAHVIRGADEIVVKFTDGRQFDATLIGQDKRSDVALLKVPVTSLATVKIGDPDKLEVGEWVLAIGSPFGFDSTATAGIVSAKGRNLPNENYVPFIQTDVAINPGNSGGPLFNLAGEVVGINAQIYSRTGGFMGLSFAIPIDIAMQVTEELKTAGEVTRGWLGVLIQSVTRDLAESFGMSKPIGALVAEIVPGSPAAESDLLVGDVIVKYDGRPVTKMPELPPMVGATAVNETVPIEVIRDGKRQTVTVKIGKLPDKIEQATSTVDDGANLVLGMRLENLTDEQKEDLGMDHGVWVKEAPRDPAHRAGIQAGDVLLQIKGQWVESVAQARSISDQLPPGKSVPVLIKRGERSLFLALKLQAETEQE